MFRPFWSRHVGLNVWVKVVGYSVKMVCHQWLPIRIVLDRHIPHSTSGFSQAGFDEKGIIVDLVWAGILQILQARIL